ncbi:MAG: TRAP transporter substrate-binding protein [Pseudomonadota bacterium]
MTDHVTNRRGALKAVTAAALALPAATLTTPALSQSRVEWRMVTSWPKNLPGPGVSARRITERVAALSDGRMTIKLYAAGEIVPALEVFQAVSSGIAQIGHTASLFWGGKLPAAPLFTAGPFGLTPLEHITWINHGGGQKAWDDLYAPFNLKPLMGGNTGFQMGGWYKEELTGLDSLRGLKIRMPGIGGAVLRVLGAAPVTLAPGEILSALQTGAIDATEFLGPSSDFAMGFYKAAKFYYSPGFHEPNGSGEVLLGKSAFDELPSDLQAIVEAACAEENIRSLGESEWQNAERLKTLVDEKGVQLRDYPSEILTAASQAAVDVLDELAQTDAASRAVIESFRAAAAHQKDWSRTSIEKFLRARG